MKAIEDEIRYLPQQNYNADTGQLARMKTIVAKLPAPKKKPAHRRLVHNKPDLLFLCRFRTAGPRVVCKSTEAGTSASPIPTTGSRTPARTHRVSRLSLCRVFSSRKKWLFGYGAVLNYYKPRANADLRQATAEFVSVLQSSDPRLRVGREAQRQVTFSSKNAILTTLNSDSIFQGQTEVDLLLTVAHPNGIFFVVFVAPESEAEYANPVFERMLQSMRFGF